MTMDEYQTKAWLTAKYPDKNNNIYYPSLGLTGEAGEFCNKVKKIMRDDNGIITDKRKDDLISELGDILWYIAALATELNTNLNDIAILNIIKLSQRQSNNSISGEGDKR